MKRLEGPDVVADERDNQYTVDKGVNDTTTQKDCD